MKVTAFGGLRVGVVSSGHESPGARRKIGFQRALDRGLDAVAVMPSVPGQEPEVPEALIEPLVHQGADLVIHGDARAYRASFLRRVPFWDNTDERHFDAQIHLQAVGLGAKIVEVAPRARGLRDRLSGWRASARYVLHRRGILYSRNFDLAASGRKYFEKFHDPASSHSRIWKWLSARGVAGTNVLELGVGDASLTRRLFEAGAVVDGVELDALAAELARPYCRAVVIDDLDALRSARIEERYDFVIAADVLEHLRDPEFVLSELKEVVRPGARLVVSLPNVANLYVRLNVVLGRFPYHTKGILDRTHLHFYTLKSAETLFAKTGWIVRERDVTAIPLVIVFPFLGKPAFRPAMAVFRLTPRLWRGLFAYQALFYLEADADD